MKTAREYISRITVVKSNLQHIADTGVINGSLLSDIERSMREYAKEVAHEALKNASENAKTEQGYCSDGWTPSVRIVDKQSILNDKNIPTL